MTSTTLPSAAEIAQQQPHHKQTGKGWSVPCPASNHPGDRSDLSCHLEDGENGLLAFCHSHSCKYEDIIKGLGLKNNPAPKKDWNKNEFLIATYQHPDETPRPVYREDHDGPCWRKDCKTDTKHKHIWGTGSQAGCLLLAWGDDNPDSDTLVLIEGEKAATALLKHNVPGFTPVTWRGGAKAVEKANYNLCKNRIVILWPDNDDAGYTAMILAGHKAISAGAAEVRIVNAFDMPPKGDAADIDAATSESMLKQAEEFDQPPPSRNPDTGQPDGLHETDDLEEGVILITDNSNGFVEGLEHLNKQIWLNERRGSIAMFDGSPFDVHLDPDKANQQEAVDKFSFAALKTTFEKQCRFERNSTKNNYLIDARFSSERFTQYANYHAHNRRFDPVKVWLESLPEWDGETRITTLVRDLLGAKDQVMATWASEAILIGSVNRTYDPGAIFDCMPIFVGIQGLGKSSFLRSLLPYDDWFTDNLEPGDDEKVIIERARDAVIAEFSDLAGMQRKEIEVLKAFISRRRDIARKAFDIDTTAADRRWIPVGTANPAANGILPYDETGQRRWGIVELNDKNAMHHDAIRAWLNDNRHLIWAEALYKFNEAVQADMGISELYRIPAYHEGVANELANQYSKRNDQAINIALRLDEMRMMAPFTMVELLVKAKVVSENDAEREAAKMKTLQMDLGQELVELKWEKERKMINGVRANRWVKIRE